MNSRRSSMFAASDICNAAEDFVEAVAEHSDPTWEADDITELAQSLTDRAFDVLRDKDKDFR